MVSVVYANIQAPTGASFWNLTVYIYTHAAIISNVQHAGLAQLGWSAHRVSRLLLLIPGRIRISIQILSQCSRTSRLYQFFEIVIDLLLTTRGVQASSHFFLWYTCYRGLRTVIPPSLLDCIGSLVRIPAARREHVYLL